jgi:hypothetical protein
MTAMGGITAIVVIILIIGLFYLVKMDYQHWVTNAKIETANYEKLTDDIKRALIIYMDEHGADIAECNSRENYLEHVRLFLMFLDDQHPGAKYSWVDDPKYKAMFEDLIVGMFKFILSKRDVELADVPIRNPMGISNSEIGPPATGPLTEPF